MHPARWVSIAAVGCALMSCAEQSMMIRDLRVSGLVSEISVPDVHAAIAADRAVTKDRVYAVDVISRDEVWIYHEPMSVRHPTRDVVKHIGGKWRFVMTPIIVG